MKEEIELFISKIAKAIKDKNYLYCVCKKGYHYGFITELFGRNNTGYCRAEPQIQKLMEFGIHPSAASDT